MSYNFAYLETTIIEYENLDEYKRTVANKSNLLKQLFESKDIISNQENNTLTDIEYATITSYIIEIYNAIQNNDLIDENTKSKMNSELLRKISLLEEFLKDKDINTIEEYYECLNTIIRILVDIELKIYLHLKNIEEYNSYSK